MSLTTLTILARWWYLDDQQLEPFLMELLEGTAWWLGPVLAIAAGALHALGPGHGKVLVGAYLAGTEGRPRDAVALGGLVSIMHTGSVLAVGVLFFSTQQLPAGDRLEGILRLVSAAAVTAVGVCLVQRALRGRTSAGAVSEGSRISGTDHPSAAPPRRHIGSHEHDGERRHDRGHSHDVGFGDGGEHPHRHHDHDHHHDLPAGVAPLSRAGIAAIATSGGLLPSPAAFLVLATSIAIGRTGYGLVLVGAFGVGLGVTLVAAGLAVLWGRDRVADLGSGRVAALAGHLPVVAASGVILGGLWLAVLAVQRL
jgi:nickel/cobalt transporter (NicO) family protein